jgi:hypothetical protein
MSTTPPPATVRRPRWPWVVLALGLIWTVAIRVPLILNAEDHLDSDLAVDGLTLLDAVDGQWRWHYPGTPHMGILPMLFSYPQALVYGANPITLVSGGTVIWLLVVVATFWLAWRAYGPSVAGWAILPLVFSSLGTIWLSGRITGGHLLTLAWHTLALVGLHACLTRGGRRRAALLGAWCGLGLYLDAMFSITLVGIATAAAIAWLWGSRSRSGIVLAAAFLGGMIVGLAPREIGRRVDPYDAYPAQFSPTFDTSAIASHAHLLAYECFPRLVAGVGLRRIGHSTGGWSSSFSSSAAGWGAVLLMVGFAAAVVRLASDVARRGDLPRRAVGLATLFSSVAIVAAFVVNKNIYNSDNYRYLIFLLTAWSLGFGVCLDDLSRRGLRARLAGGILAVVLAAAMTVAAFRWYRNTRQYVDDRGFPSRRAHAEWSELVVLADRPPPGTRRPSAPRTERFTIPADLTHVFGGYWDVYRLSFRSGKRIVGIPYSMYPNRFPGWSSGLGPGRGKILILRPGEETGPALALRPAAELPAARSDRVRSVRAIDWHPAFRTAWQADGRDPSELDRLDVVVP